MDYYEKLDEWEIERQDVLKRFNVELAKVTQDGSNKRQKGLKKAWWQDTTHFDRAMSHIDKYVNDELIDKDSGQHPLVHAAWRLLAIACSETGNTPDEKDPLRYDGPRL